MFKVKGLSKSFMQGGREIKALEDVSFELAKGDSLALVGPSGSGKTTLLSLLAGLESASKGQVQISNEMITDYSEQELANFRAKNMGMVFQQFHLMPHLTALENVTLPLDILHQSDTDLAMRALESVGLSGRKDHLPQQLSGGECQRVAIARAFVTEPRILLADEPSGNLDRDSADNVIELLFRLVKEKNVTLILVTHDLDLADRCQHQLKLSGGRLQ